MLFNLRRLKILIARSKAIPINIPDATPAPRFPNTPPPPFVELVKVGEIVGNWVGVDVGVLVGEAMGVAVGVKVGGSVGILVGGNRLQKGCRNRLQI